MIKRQVSVPVELVELIGKEKIQKICREFFDENNDKPLMEEYNKAKRIFALWQDLRNTLMTKQSDDSRRILNAYNKEYSDIEPFYPDDCQEFNVPNLL